jgi:hypothetical protein
MILEKMRKTIIIFLGCGLSACAGMHGAAPGDRFSSSLHNEYAILAAKNDARHDWLDALHFRRKAGRASAGESVLPDSPAGINLKRSAKRKANLSYKQLTASLRPDNKRLFPETLAHAQAMYDCWIMALHKNTRSEAQTCLSGFERAMIPLEQHQHAVNSRSSLTLLPAVNSYTVYFDPKKSDINYEAARILDQVEQDAEKYKPSDITIIGYGDRTGKAANDRALAFRRATAVIQKLQERGITSHVPTNKIPAAKASKMRENRAVVIDFVK